MTTALPPTEKQLLHLSLVKGMNERDRPETADQETCLTRVENLIQDQSGAYVKRPGDTIIASTYASSQSISKPQRLVRTVDGLALINYRGGFSSFDEGYSKFMKYPTIYGNDKSVATLSTNKATVVGSSGTSTKAQIVAAASSTKYHAVVSYAGLDAAAANTKLLTIVDRESGHEAAAYDLGTIMGAYVGVNDYVKMAFVGDRYLMVFQNNNSVSIDTGGTNITKTAAAPFAASADSPGAYDLAVSGTRAFIVSAILGSYSIYAVDAATNAVAENFALTEASFVFVKGADIYYAGAIKLGSRTHADLTVASVAAYNHTVPATLAGFAVDAINDWAWFIATSTPAFGTTTVPRMDVYFASDIAGSGAAVLNSTIDGWIPLSNPFQCGAVADDALDSDIVYIHAVKYSGTELAQHAILNISTTHSNTNNAQSYEAHRIDCSLEPYNGVYVVSEGSTPYRVWETSAGMCSPVVPIRLSARACTFAFFDLRSSFHSRLNAASYGGIDYLSGGAHSMWDGRCLNEVGFVDHPLVNASQSATAGAIVAGIYNFIAVYRHVNSRASSTFSKVSSVSTVTNAGSFKNSVSVLPCFVTNKIDSTAQSAAATGGGVIIDLYRTTSGGTTYYLCASSQDNTPLGSLLTQPLLLQATGRFTVSDNLTDAQLAAQPQMHRQPGTPNTSLDRYPPPSGNIICQHADRVFCADPYGSRVYYSSFHVDGESAWFNPQFSMFVHGGSGPITSIVSMDGRLIVFKKDAIFVIDGDGPAESGPSGNEFSPAKRLATEYGCIDSRSTIVTTEGIAYRSARGIELLTRSLQVKWVGDRVQNTCNDYPYTCGSAIDTFGRVHWLFAATDPGVGNVSSAGRDLVWDIPADCWTVGVHTPSDGVYGNSMQDIVRADIHGSGETIYLADPLVGIVKSDAASGIDRTAYIKTVLETSWIRTGQQARQRINDAYFLAKKIGNHAIKISAAYDYVDTYTESVTWEPNVINALTIEELVLQFSKPQSLAVRLKIEELAATDQVTYPTGTGLGCAYLGVTFQVIPMIGAPHVAAGSRVGGGGTSFSQPFISGVCDATGGEAGGDAVRVLGSGFIGATGVLFGADAATSVVVVSDSEITCVTPAHAVGAVSVTVNSANGTATRGAAFTYTSGAFVGLSGLKLQVWQRDFGGASPWAGTASAGYSGDRHAVTHGTGVIPTSGTLNGHPTAIFTSASTNAMDVTDPTIASMYPAQVVSPRLAIMVLMRLTAPPPADSTHYYEGPIFGWSYFECMTAATSGFRTTFYPPSAGFVSTPYQALPAVGTWFLAKVYWEEDTASVHPAEPAKLYAGLNSGAYQGVACGFGNNSGTPMLLGVNYADTIWADMEVAEVIVSGNKFTSAEEAGIIAELNTRYALAL